GIRVFHVTGVQTCALPISSRSGRGGRGERAGLGPAGGVMEGPRVVRADGPGGVLPGEGRLDPGGEADLLAVRGQVRVPGVRAGADRKSVVEGKRTEIGLSG